MLSYLMASYSTLTQRFRKDDRGVTAVEYALLVALIALVVAGGATLLGTNINSLFSTAANKVSSAG